MNPYRSLPLELEPATIVAAAAITTMQAQATEGAGVAECRQAVGHTWEGGGAYLNNAERRGDLGV